MSTDDLALPIEKLGDWDDVSPNFTPGEILSPDTIDKIYVVDYEALLKLNRFRNYLHKPLLVNHAGLHMRGVRSAREQMSLVDKGLTTALSSFHLQGKAFDISCPGMTVTKLAEAAKDFAWTGIGLYKSKGFVHIDLRPSELTGVQVYYEVP